MQINKQIILVCSIVTAMIFSSCSISKKSITRYKTMTQRAQMELQMDQHQYNIGCNMRIWHNELMIISVQPMLGIEMIRIETTQDSIWIFDKMNRRYAEVDYASINRIVQPNVSYKMLQDWFNLPTLPSKNEKAHLEFSAGQHHVKMTCKSSNREYNTLQAPQRTNCSKYKKVNLRTILPL